MIIDSLSNATKYYSLCPRIEAALRYLAENDLTDAEPGRVDILGDECYALIQKYDTRPPDDCKWEAHIRYIDVQFVAGGVEKMGWAPLGSMTMQADYSDTKDQIVYQGDGSFITVTEGFFAIFGPSDIHMPCLADGEPASVTKVVVKVMI
ncbi:MAG: YhcH/YjgK/YiaL family protein [Armatimonadota bacterium]